MYTVHKNELQMDQNCGKPMNPWMNVKSGWSPKRLCIIKMGMTMLKNKALGSWGIGKTFLDPAQKSKASTSENRSIYK